MQKACVIIPCFNEAQRLDFSAFDKFIESNTTVDFLFANDGSTDNTADLILKYKAKHQQRVELFNIGVNSGKAEVVRQAFIKACKTNNYNFVGFWDADLATPLSEITYFLAQATDNNKSIAIGSRMKRLGAIVERKRSRHFLGRIFSTFSSIILKLPVYDTQCGAKLFRADLAFLFEDKFITSWLFDVELLARYRNKFGIEHTLANVVEVPVNAWMEKGGSKLKLKHMLKVPLELLRIHNKYN